ncbi:MAG: DUF3445 domain-containing protein [Sulfitobacter sp.]
MDAILQTAIPEEMQAPNTLPGVAPCAADDWLRVDDAYAAQMRYRIELMKENIGDVMWTSPEAHPATLEVLDEALKHLPALGFGVQETEVRCPDGRVVLLDRAAPLQTLSHLVQEDICVLQKSGAEHVLTAAALCFPASWRLRDKVGRPLTTIHDPVLEYDESIARRVQRLFDGVKAGKPLWRYNRLGYSDGNLHQPSRQNQTRSARFLRSERQCILRLPRTQAVIFSIHTYQVMLEQNRATIKAARAEG